MKTERRSFAIDGLEIREGGEDKSPTIVGHAAVFGSLSKDLGGFREIIAPGAFDGHEDMDVRALFNHSPDMVLGRNKAGTLRLTQDETGLRVEIDPPDTTFANDLLVSMRRGDIDQMSFGFRTINDKWETVDGEDIRTLEKVELFDVSPVVFPAYTDTDVAVRSLEEYRAYREDAEQRKEAGLSVAMADTRLRLAELE